MLKPTFCKKENFKELIDFIKKKLAPKKHTNGKS